MSCLSLERVERGHEHCGAKTGTPFLRREAERQDSLLQREVRSEAGCNRMGPGEYSYGATEEDALEKLKYDLYYIKNMSLIIDLMVILHTVKIVLLAEAPGKGQFDGSTG